MNDEMVVRQSYSELIRLLLNFVIDRLIVRYTVCTYLLATYHLSIAYLASYLAREQGIAQAIINHA